MGLTIKDTKLSLDTLLFPALKASQDQEKTLDELRSTIQGTRVKSVGRHGKYFWLRLEKLHQPPTVMLMHFGMTGMVKLKDVESHLVFMENGGDKKLANESKDNVQKSENVVVEDSVEHTVEEQLKSKMVSKRASVEGIGDAEWPPRFTKFELTLQDTESSSDKDSTTVNLAFTDPRRLGRVRVLTGDNFATDKQLLEQEPLKNLGPDYSKNPDLEAELVKKEFQFGDPDPSTHGRPRPGYKEFGQLILGKKKAIKSILLEQELFAGVGNWVGDEVLFHAQIHPNETLSKKLFDPEDEVLKRLYDSIIYVMEESVKVEGDVRRFPDHWLMLYRWGKGRKERTKTKAGDLVDHVTVGGRTSCFVPAVQKPLKRRVNVKEEKQEEVKKPAEPTEEEESANRRSKRQKIRSFKNEAD